MQPSRLLDPDVAHLVFHLRPARCRAQAAAVAEALSLLRGLHPSAPRGGPLSEQGGVFWVDLPRDQLQASCARLPRLGYSTAVDLIDPLPTGAPEHPTPLRWRGRFCRLQRVYQEDAAAFRQAAPDRRCFILPGPDDQPRFVEGTEVMADP